MTNEGVGKCLTVNESSIVFIAYILMFNSMDNRDYRSFFVADWGLGIEVSQFAQHLISAN
jgi:hypothetical protein